MTIVVSLEAYKPANRYDAIPWTDARIEEAPASTGPWTILETQALSPVDTDPEHPAYRNFTTTLGTDEELWYRIVFLDAGSNLGLPTIPVQNIEEEHPVYATIDELARILKIRTPSEEQEVAMDRVLRAAAREINSEVDFEDDTQLEGNERAIAEEVNLERAVEHWRQQESPFGLVGLGPELGSSFTARDSWERHAHKLAPLKRQWGLA